MVHNIYSMALFIVLFRWFVYLVFDDGYVLGLMQSAKSRWPVARSTMSLQLWTYWFARNTWGFMPPPMYDLKSEWMFGVSRLGHSVGSRFSDWGVTACTSWDVVPISFSCFGGLSRFWAVWVDWQCYIQGLLFFPFVGQLLVNLAGFCPKHNPFADYHMIKLIYSRMFWFKLLQWFWRWYQQASVIFNF